MAAAASIVGTGLSMLGSIKQGNDEANVSDYNAQIASQNAGLAVEQSSEDARRSLVKTAMVVGNDQANYAASGVTGEGSAADVLRSSAAQGELDALSIQNQGAVKANAYMNEAQLDEYKGSNDQESGYLGAAASLGKSAAGAGAK